MKLVRLKLSHFRQHVDSTIEFGSGITGLVGPNGAGKSTLIEAIGFALYGAKALRSRVDEARSSGATGNLEVSLHLEHAGQALTVVRGASDAELFLGGERSPLCSGNREVTARLTSLLGMNFEEFQATFYTEQKGLEFLSGKRGTRERERFIVRMMGYDKLERLQELLREDRKLKRAELAGFEGALGSREAIERQIALEEASLATQSHALAEATRVLEEAQREAAAAQVTFERIDAHSGEYRRKRDEIATLAARFEEQARRGKLVERELRDLREQFGPTLEPLSVLEEQLSQAERDLSSMREQVQREELKLRESQGGARARLASITKQIELLMKKRTERPKAGSNCPTCGQELGEAFREVEAHFAREIALLEDQRREHEGAVQALDTVPAELIELRRQLQLRTERFAQLGPGLQASRRITELEADLVRIRANLIESDKALATLRGAIASGGFSEENHRAARTARDATHRLEEVARLARVRAEGESARLAALLDRTRAELSTYHARVSATGAVRRELLICEGADELLTEFGRHLHGSIRPRLAELASDFIAELTDGRYTTVHLDDDFSPQVIEDGLAKVALSGGEEDILNLTLRLALSHLLAERSGHEFSLLILDEVFGSLDESRRGNVLLLLERLRSRFEQILVITHCDDIKEGVENLVSVSVEAGKAVIQCGEALFQAGTLEDLLDSADYDSAHHDASRERLAHG